MYSVHCTILTIKNGTLIDPCTEIQWSAYIVHCTKCTVYTVYSVHCVQCMLHWILVRGLIRVSFIIVNIVQCTLYNVQCTLYNTHNKKWNSYRPVHWDSMKCVHCTLYKVYSVHCVQCMLHWILVRGLIRVSFIIVNIVQCTLYNVQCTLHNTHNKKWNSYRPVHWDSMKCVPLRNPIYYCEYYRGIMFQLPPTLYSVQCTMFNNVHRTMYTIPL